MGRPALTPKLIASAATTVGVVLLVAGAALIYVPAGVLLAGGALVALGLLVIDV